MGGARTIALVLLVAGCGRLDFGDTTRDAHDDAPPITCDQPATWYEDLDADGHGDAARPIQACVQPANAVANADDCNDAERFSYSSATEVCDGIDNDCNAATTETCPPTCVPMRRPPPDDSHVYLFCDNTNTVYTVARDTCVAAGYTLARIDDDVENSWLAATAFSIHGTVQQFIGANDLDVEGVWVWPDGTQFWQGVSPTGMRIGNLYNNWKAQEPNDTGGEDCGELVDTGVWNDIVELSQRAYVCEKQ